MISEADAETIASLTAERNAAVAALYFCGVNLIGLSPIQAAHSTVVTLYVWAKEPDRAAAIHAYIKNPTGDPPAVSQ
jgi:hypothetical protein